MVPATIAKIAVTFGLVTIPVTVHSSTEEHGVTAHLVHAEDGGRIRLRRTCEKCGQEVPYADVARGYQDAAGRTAVLTEADMDALPLPSVKAIDVLAFVDAASIDPIQLSKAYYLAPDTSAAKPYVLLRDAMTAAGRVAVTKVTLRTGSHENLALLRVHGDTMVLQTMYWPDEVRPPTGLAPPADVTVRPQEVSMATGLMEAMSEGFDMAVLHDDYRKALDRLVVAKLEGQPMPAGEETARAPEDIVDLMAALQASIDARETPPGPRAKTAPPANRPRRG